ncbi:hypothetical protein H0H81_005394 [Sphagnurus paluster]|uniref:Angiogenic factor with G patch and FHA domains 1 n=1 Tax=Sphagnurus paluster TaxID=117069 RepID=A0A9P7GLQ9_9AGAR|nr:hypothetical protein H0H81_005394 [Sphagnurus paluster]
MGSDSEEGEIYEAPTTYVSQRGDGYDPSYEWPGEDTSCTPSPSTQLEQGASPAPKQATNTLRPNQPIFRLLVLRTSIISSKHRLAVIDGYSEIQFGRDVAPAGSTTPKIRLKEMEVSKVHATAYWDASRKEWGIVDMGSVHGTFLHSASGPASGGGDPAVDRGVRLSPPRQASIPRKINHLDRLTIGGTTFLVHFHQDRLPCEECSTSGKDEIPLFPVSKHASKTLIADAGSVTPPSGSYTPKSARDALTMLKQSLLTRHGDARPKSAPPADQVSTEYVDRSARRRALMPASHPDAPGVVSSATPTWTQPEPQPPVSLEPISQPPKPLSSSNIGHRLLRKQGWEPGTSLGSPLESGEGRAGLIEPIEVSASVNRGLKRSSTMSLPSLSDPDWKETAKRKRWDRL